MGDKDLGNAHVRRSDFVDDADVRKGEKGGGGPIKHERKLTIQKVLAPNGLTQVR